MSIKVSILSKKQKHCSAFYRTALNIAKGNNSGSPFSLVLPLIPFPYNWHIFRSEYTFLLLLSLFCGLK